jgi:putative addiction module component (TIGR02574 family)
LRRPACRASLRSAPTYAPARWSKHMNSQLLRQASELGVDEQIELAGAIWDGIVRRDAVPPLTQAQKLELARRLEDHLANPEDVVSWSGVKAATLAKINRYESRV